MVAQQGLATTNIALSVAGRPRPAFDIGAFSGLRQWIGRTWRRQLIRRSCHATRIVLKGLDDRRLEAIGIERSEINADVARLEAELLQRAKQSSPPA